MTTMSPEEVQKKRLLRLTIAHYRREDCSEEEFYRWGSEVYTPQAVKFHIKYGMEGYAFVSDSHCLCSSFVGFLFG